jgi:hypothetical protein
MSAANLDTYVAVNRDGTLDVTCAACHKYGPSGGRHSPEDGLFYWYLHRRRPLRRTPSDRGRAELLGTFVAVCR